MDHYLRAVQPGPRTLRVSRNFVASAHNPTGYFPWCPPPASEYPGPDLPYAALNWYGSALAFSPPHILLPNYLRGTIPESVSNLTALTSLSLGAEPFLTGTLPDSVTTLRELMWV